MAICHNKQFENYYCKYCRGRGEFAVRVAGSGASEGACCDVIRIAGGTYLVEVKATKEAVFKPVKSVKEQLEKLREQAMSVHAVPMLAIRFKNRGWSEINMTGGVPESVGDENV